MSIRHMHPLAYQIRRPHPKRWFKLTALTALVAIGVLSYLRWGAALADEVRCRYWVGRCLRYSMPADAEASSGLPKCWFPFATSGPRGPISPFNRYTDHMVFLHERWTPDGTRRLVAVNAVTSQYIDQDVEQDDQWPDKRPCNRMYLEINVLDPKGIHRMASSDSERFTPAKPSVFWEMGQANRMKVMNGVADPTDLSHFTFVYDLDGECGIVDGWLVDDENIKLTMRSGPSLKFQMP